MSADSESISYTPEEVNLVEAVLFSSPRPMPVNELKRLLPSRHKGGVRGIIACLNNKYMVGSHSFRIREVGGGFQFYLLPDYAVGVEKYFSVQRDRRLTPAGLETLAIVAYKQPITKGEIEQIRGVSVDGVIQTLLERKLIKPAGRANRIGRPLLYATTQKFLEYFGINSLEQLPKLSEVLPKTHSASPQNVLALEDAYEEGDAHTGVTTASVDSPGNDAGSDS